MDIKKYEFSFGKHLDKNVIWIGFEYSNELKSALKTRFPSAKWSNHHKKWYLLDLSAIRKVLGLDAKKINCQRFQNISPKNQKALELYI